MTTFEEEIRQLLRESSDTSRERCNQLRDHFFDVFPEVRRFVEDIDRYSSPVERLRLDREKEMILEHFDTYPPDYDIEWTLPEGYDGAQFLEMDEYCPSNPREALQYIMEKFVGDTACNDATEEIEDD